MKIIWTYLTNIFQTKVLQPLQYFAVVEETATANDMSKHRAHTTKYEDLCM